MFGSIFHICKEYNNINKKRMSMKEVKLYIEDNGYRGYEDTDVLLEQIKDEYDVPRPILLQLSDIEGQVVT